MAMFISGSSSSTGSFGSLVVGTSTGMEERVDLWVKNTIGATAIIVGDGSADTTTLKIGTSHGRHWAFTALPYNTNSNSAYDLQIGYTTGNELSGSILITDVKGVGIGTSTTDGLLTIKARSSGDDMLRLQDSGGATLMHFYNSSDDAIFYMNKDGATTTVQVHSDGVSYFNGGNVGIGTTDIASVLHLYEETSNTTTASNVLTIDSMSSGTTGVGFGGGIQFRGERNGGTLQAMGKILCVADVNTSSNLSSALTFQTATGGSNSEKMRITSAGNVGIGTSTITNSAKLDIYSSATSGHFLGLQIRRPNSAGITSAIEFTLTNDIMVGKIQHDYVASNHNDMSFHLRQAAGPDAEVMRLCAPTGTDTRVGIGTTVPSRPLHMVHTGGEYNFLVEGITSGHCGIEIKNNVASNTNLLFRNPSYVQELYMDSSGNFHIYRGGNNFTLTQAGNATFAGDLLIHGDTVQRVATSGTNIFAFSGASDDSEGWFLRQKHESDGSGVFQIARRWGGSYPAISSYALEFSSGGNVAKFSGAVSITKSSAGTNFSIGGYNGRAIDFYSPGADRQFYFGLNTSAANYIAAKSTSTGAMYFGVGVSPAQYTLDVAGNIGYSGSITDYSLRSTKKDIVEIDGVGMIEKVKKLPLYKYNLKTEPMALKAEDEVYKRSKGRYGLIADDEVNLEEFPELINWGQHEDEDEPRIVGIDTTAYIGVLHGAIKELIAKVEALENA